MAQHKSAKTRIRRNERRSRINQARRGRIRTFIRNVEVAIDSGDRAAAADAFRKAMPEIMRGGTKGILHKNTIARKLSRLNARINRMAA